MKFRLEGVFLCLSLIATVSSSYAEKPWTEVRSPHFRVLTDGSAKDARHVAHEFEQMHSLFASQFPQFRLESGAPLVIFAARDEQTAKALEPVVWKTKGVKPAGIFHHSWEKQYVMVRLDQMGPGEDAVVYHEYTHSILHLNAHWLPTWLDEGLAEFYGYTRFEHQQIYVGAVTGRYPMLLHGIPIPVKTLIAVDQASPYYRSADKVDMFYAESWALVHYLTFGPGMDRGAKLNQFFSLLQQGKEQNQAFQQVFGNFEDVDGKLRRYMENFSFSAAVLKDPPQIDEKAFSSTALSLAQTDAELAGFHLWTHDLENAQILADKALKADPKLGLAHEEEGFLYFAQGKDGEAAGEFSQAYALDPNLYLSLFAKTMLSPIATSDVPEDKAAFRNNLAKVADLDIQFAPAYVQLAWLAARRNDLKTAYGLSRRAEELEPSRAGYHLLTGRILLRMGKNTEAAGFAQYVAQRWYGPDHNEAVELWNDIPAAQRPAGPPMTEDSLKETKTAAGLIKSTSCGGPAKGEAITLMHNGHPLTFRVKGPVIFGFSDTIWYGEDHFSVCHHMKGLRAVVDYRPASDSSYAGDIAQIEIRDDLGAAVVTSGVQQAAKP